ncbi:beta-glucosidase [Pseudomonas sp. S25]|uniref:Beta-glucosidase n=1 Tax=Pseudomonas maioricensis TaxID=1766623 RepID=A0ABS9ZN40_9PSED|nr:beta-glucosidase [Pseudomonas sp. S25]MCI8211989.1 beta-glucosidase [Pseudomonas sp. S25]
MKNTRLFSSFLMAGYECATQRRKDGLRLDLLATTGHAQWVDKDYSQLAGLGIGCVRDGLRWHLIETQAYRYDWSSFLPMLRAARDHHIQVVWDLCHYGYPDGLDIWRPEFVERFARFAGAVARLMKEEGVDAPFFSPLNEVSFWSWAGGEVGYFNPGMCGRGQELKHQLVRASIAATVAIREQVPAARFVQCEPLINVMAASSRTDKVNNAERHRLSQFETWDMLAGRQWPGLGGREEYLDIIGANFYPHNQWFLNGAKILRGDRHFRPLAGMLKELQQRYQRPLLISETGAESDERVPWLSYISEQITLAQQRGVVVEALCWYPFLDYPGWDDGRYCPAGVFGYADGEGNRAPYHPLHVQMQALQRQTWSL